jgi:hypothetical protein
MNKPAVLLLALAAAMAPSCDKHKVPDLIGFAEIVSVATPYVPDEVGAALYVQDLVIRYVNPDSVARQAELTIEWGGDFTETVLLSFRATGGEEIKETFLTRYSRIRNYSFHEEITVTLRLTVRFMGYTSQAVSRDVTMLPWGGI